MASTKENTAMLHILLSLLWLQEVNGQSRPYNMTPWPHSDINDDFHPKNDYYLHCGNYIHLETKDSVVREGHLGNIYSPYFPGKYKTNMNCIWRLDLELGFRNKKKYHSHQIQLKIPQFRGSKHDRVNLRNKAQALARTQNVSAQGPRFKDNKVIDSKILDHLNKVDMDLHNCSDYLEIRDGNSTSKRLALLCGDDDHDVTVTSTHTWMWIRFKTDNTDDNSPNTAWMIEVHVVKRQRELKQLDDHGRGIISWTAQPTCRSYQFQCRNKECISMSYRCNGINDCGCMQGCDEDYCTGLDMTGMQQIAISLSCGFLIIVFIALGGVLVEKKDMWLAVKQQEVMEMQNAELRRRRASKLVNQFFTTNMGE